jgi:hypothetical protein
LQNPGKAVYTGTDAIDGRMEGKITGMQAKADGSVIIEMQLAAPKKARWAQARVDLATQTFDDFAYEEE